jgi:ABC-type ATPase involved in cell division
MHQTLTEPGASVPHETHEPEAVWIRGLCKSYGETMALDGVNLTIRRGEVFGLLGPNGAGKTTLVEILEGHRTRDGGDISVLGFDPQERSQDFRDRIGVVLQEGGHIPTMTVIEAVRLFSAAYPRPLDALRVLELAGLADKAGARIGTLSGGQRRRLDFAVGIGGDPDVIFLDEPLWTPSSPTMRSTHRPSTVPSPSSSRPSSTKNAVTALRSSTTMPTLSIRRTVISPRVDSSLAPPGARVLRSAQPLAGQSRSYSSWRRIQTCHSSPSFRPFGARSRIP